MASKYNKKFENEMTIFIEKAKKNMDTVKMLAVYQLCCEIIDLTPKWYKDAGTTKWNWTVSVGAPDTRVLTGKDPQGTQRKKQIYSKLKTISEMPGEEDIYIANSVPWIRSLEYGGYPSPVKKGSYNSKLKKYEQRSEGGFSKQAPVGCYVSAHYNGVDMWLTRPK